jgi:hypothetical protein
MEPEGLLLSPQAAIYTVVSHILKRYFCKICFNIILPSTLIPPKRSQSSRFSGRSVYKFVITPLPATCPAHLIFLTWLSFTNNIWTRVQSVIYLITQFYLACP